MSSAAEAPDDVGALLADHRDDVRATALRLRQVLLDGHPQLVERVRTGWVFERGASLPDPYRRLTGTGRQVRALEFADEDDVDPAMVLEYLDLAVEIGTGLRARR